MSAAATSERQSFYYGDLAEGIRRLQQQVARINMVRKMQAAGADVPLLDPLTISVKYCRKWMRFYGFNSKYAPVKPRFAKGVDLALRIINEGEKNAARSR